MINTISLLSDTLRAGLRVNRLKIHMLDTRKSVLLKLNRVDKSVARIFSTSLQNTKEGECNEEI